MMKLNDAGLRKQRLQKKPLSSLYWVQGDEPLLVQESLDQVREQAREQGWSSRQCFDVSDAGFQWAMVFSALQQPSLFGRPPWIEINFPSSKQKAQQGRALNELVQTLKQGQLMLLKSDRVDYATQKSQWFHAIEQQAVIVEVATVKKESLPSWLQQRAQTWGLTLEEGVANILAERTEGHLLAANQELEKLALAGHQHIDVDTLLHYVTDNARFVIFQVADFALQGDCHRVIKSIDQLKQQGEAAPLLLWVLARDVRLLSQWSLAASEKEKTALLRAFNVWGARRGWVQQASHRYSSAAWMKCLTWAQAIDQMIKGQHWMDHWTMLQHLALFMAGEHKGAQAWSTLM